MALLLEALQGRNNEYGFNLVVYNPQFTVRTQQLCKARNVFIKWRKWKRRLMSHRTYLRCCLHSCPKPLLASQSISAHQGNLYIVPTIALRPIIGMPWHTKIFTRKAGRSWMQAQRCITVWVYPKGGCKHLLLVRHHFKGEMSGLYTLCERSRAKRGELAERRLSSQGERA